MMAGTSVRSLTGATRALDAVFLLCLIGASVVLGFRNLEHWNGPGGSVSTNLYIASAMAAWGKGFVDASPSDAPALREFVNFERMALSADDLPDELPTRAAHTFQRYHRYLLYTVAAVWRHAGVSWDSLKYVIVALLAVTAAVLYGIFRLGMNPFFSAAGVWLFLSSRALASQLPCLRDFGKAPFLLGVILLLGLLLIRPRKPKALLAGAVLLGAVIGLGTGFRRDVLIALPAAIVALACFASVTGRRPQAWRGAAVLLLTVSAVTSAWPVLKSFRDEGTLAPHDMLMGMATVYDNELGLRSASYERFYVGNDLFISDSTAAQFGDRPAAPHKELFLARLATVFPADLVTRVYAAVVRVVGGVFADSDRYGIRTYALLAAALVVLSLTICQPRLGLAVSFLAAFFGGYVSLQYAARHAFHLGFAPYWFLGVALDAPLRAGARVLVRRFRNSEPAPLLPQGSLRRLGKRAAVAVSLWVGALLIPLFLLRAYQSVTVGKLLAAYSEADLEPIQTRPVVDGAWTLFRPMDRRDLANGAWRSPVEPLRASYLAAVLEVPPERYAWLRYEIGRRGGGEYSELVNVEPTGLVEGGPVTYFFPVYEHDPPHPWNRFAGLALRTEHAGTFKGLYRVRGFEAFPLLLTVALPGDLRLCRPYQTVFGRDGRTRWPRLRVAPEAPLWRAQDESAALDLRGDWAGAVRACESGLAEHPDNLELLVRLAHGHAALGETDAARDAYFKAMRAHPGEGSVYQGLNALALPAGSATGRLAPH